MSFRCTVPFGHARDGFSGGCVYETHIMKNGLNGGCIATGLKIGTVCVSM